ncbi:family 16 glycosylhydrolase [Tamlana sp. I1]|uniref:family 16 glycosylhydrolase n=1 Tax=Tamlana sp. I1 TaxID=2762061 RepID=UPI001E5ADE77|nr:family 16 glycosylhydrolase [Tamlana sp. I1]
MTCSLCIYLMLLFCCGSHPDPIEADTPKEDMEIIPTNLDFKVTIVNADTNNPNGDGNGKITITASATNATKYKFTFGAGNHIENTSGNTEFTYTEIGTHTYTVSVFAYSATNNSISAFKSVTIFVKEPELTLVWSDEFDIDGAVLATNWTAETTPANNANLSWFNGEKQHYTDRLDNAYVSNGTLKIIAKKESFTYTEPGSGRTSTKAYTSARLITQGKQEFTYGRIDVRAKLPQGDGTWPAIWTLGANMNTVGWPACGEIDIMEHWGYNPGIVSSATHTTACSGGCKNVTVGETLLTDFSSEFHVYSVVWTSEELRFLIDGEFKYRYKPSTKTNENWPYTANQFIILNVAMGGDWFTIGPNFTTATMEVDYVRVYQ